MKGRQKGRRRAKIRRAARRVGARSKQVLGLSVPVVTQGAVTAGGLFVANLGAAKASEALRNQPWAQEWYSRAGFKVGVGVLAKMVLNRVDRNWGNAALAGALAAAALTVAKRFVGDRFDQGWGLAGDLGRLDVADADLDRMALEVRSMQHALHGLVSTEDVYSGNIYGVAGLTDSTALQHAAGILS